MYKWCTIPRQVALSVVGIEFQPKHKQANTRLSCQMHNKKRASKVPVGGESRRRKWDEPLGLKKKKCVKG